MKRYLLIPLVVFNISGVCAQTIAIKYKSSKKADTKLESQLMKGISVGHSQDAYSYQSEMIDLNMIDSARAVSGTHANVNRSEYGKIADINFAKAEILKAAINEKYDSLRSLLKEELAKAADLDEAKAINDSLEINEERRKEDIKKAEYFNNLGKGWEYRDRLLHNYFFPVHNSIDAQLYYEDGLKDKRSRFLQNSMVKYSPDGGRASVYNELWSDYAGFSRIGVGVMISNKSNPASDKGKDSAIQKDAIQRLVGGGGNFVVGGSIPAIGFTSRDERFAVKILLAPKFGLDVPKLGTDKADYATNVDLGSEGVAFYTMKNDVITLFCNFRFGYVFGNSVFYKNLLKDDATGFAFHQISAGIALNSTFRINWNFYFGSDFVKSNFGNSIGFSIVPN